MKGLFVELPPFERYRAEHLDDDAFRTLQIVLMIDPEAGDVIQGTGGLRKIRFADDRRQKGKRGGIRIIYYWAPENARNWLFTVYGKNDQDDLSEQQKKVFRKLIEQELKARTPS